MFMVDKLIIFTAFELLIFQSSHKSNTTLCVSPIVLVYICVCSMSFANAEKIARRIDNFCMQNVINTIK